MPTNPTPTAEAVSAAAPPTPPKDTEPDEQFRVDELPTYAAAIGAPVHEIVGAFALTAPSKKVTITAAKKRVAEWLKGEVATDPAHAEEE